MSLVQDSTNLIIKPPYSNYLGGNTALYESNQTQSSQMKGGSRRRKRKELPRKSLKHRRTRGRKCKCKTKRTHRHYTYRKNLR